MNSDERLPMRIATGRGPAKLVCVAAWVHSSLHVFQRSISYIFKMRRSSFNDSQCERCRSLRQMLVRAKQIPDGFVGNRTPMCWSGAPPDKTPRRLTPHPPPEIRKGVTV